MTVPGSVDHGCFRGDPLVELDERVLGPRRLGRELRRLLRQLGRASPQCGELLLRSGGVVPGLQRGGQVIGCLLRDRAGRFDVETSRRHGEAGELCSKGGQRLPGLDDHGTQVLDLLLLPGDLLGRNGAGGGPHRRRVVDGPADRTRLSVQQCEAELSGDVVDASLAQPREAASPSRAAARAPVASASTSGSRAEAAASSTAASSCRFARTAAACRASRSEWRWRAAARDSSRDRIDRGSASSSVVTWLSPVRARSARARACSSWVRRSEARPPALSQPSAPRPPRGWMRRDPELRDGQLALVREHPGPGRRNRHVGTLEGRLALGQRAHGAGDGPGLTRARHLAPQLVELDRSRPQRLVLALQLDEPLPPLPPQLGGVDHLGHLPVRLDRLAAGLGGVPLPGGQLVDHLSQLATEVTGCRLGQGHQLVAPLRLDPGRDGEGVDGVADLATAPCRRA